MFIYFMLTCLLVVVCSCACLLCGDDVLTGSSLHCSYLRLVSKLITTTAIHDDVPTNIHVPASGIVYKETSVLPHTA